MTGEGGLADPAFPLRDAAGVPYVAAAVLERIGGLRHWFGTRRGGDSAAPFDSLNLAYGIGDDRDAVERNRNRCWEAMGLPRPPLIPRQVHGSAVVIVDAGNHDRLLADPPEADAVATAVRGIPLAILTADCVPIIVCDTATPALAVVHAGWRGTVAAALWRTLLTMFDSFGTRSEDCVAAIGPSIAGPCYEVGEDVRTAFVHALPYGQDVLAPAGPQFKWLADLREANRRQLLDGRLVPARVGVCPYCTHCEAGWFHSARRDRGGSGRQAAVAMLA